MPSDYLIVPSYNFMCDASLPRRARAKLWRASYLNIGNIPQLAKPRHLGDNLLFIAVPADRRMFLRVPSY